MDSHTSSPLNKDTFLYESPNDKRPKLIVTLPFDVPNEIHGVVGGADEPSRRVKLQRCLEAVVLYELAAVQRVRHKLLQHVGAEFPVFDGELEVLLGGRPHVDLAR